MLFNKQGVPCDALKKVLILTDIQHDGTVQDIVQKTQAAWLRKPGTERWQMEKEPHAQNKTLWHAFKDLNLINEIKPQQKEYDYILFMGATVARMKKRFDYFINLCKEGLHCAKFVILSGERPLDVSLQEKEQITQICPKARDVETEFDAARCIVDAWGDNTPEIIYCNAPMKEDPKTGKKVRPTTDDTIIAFMATNPKPGRCLVISNQPYGLRQQAVVQGLLSSDWVIDVASEGCSEKESDSVILDDLARYIYQEYKQFFEKK